MYDERGRHAPNTNANEQHHDDAAKSSASATNANAVDDAAPATPTDVRDAKYGWRPGVYEQSLIFSVSMPPTHDANEHDEW